MFGAAPELRQDLLELRRGRLRLWPRLAAAAGGGLGGTARIVLFLLIVGFIGLLQRGCGVDTSWYDVTIRTIWHCSCWLVSVNCGLYRAPLIGGLGLIQVDMI